MVAEALVEASEQSERNLGLAGVGGAVGEAGDVLGLVQRKRGIKQLAFARHVDGTAILVLRQKYRDVLFSVRREFGLVAVLAQPVPVLVVHRQQIGMRGEFIAQQGDRTAHVAAR